MPAAKLSKKAVSKTATKKVSTKAPAKKSLFKKVFSSQKGLIKAKNFSRPQFLITAMILSTIGIIGVVASHGSSKSALKTPTPAGYGCQNPSTVGEGSSGACVKYVQALLNYNGANLKVDGKFGPKTKAAASQYQNSKTGLVADGIVGSKTLTAITADSATKAAASKPKPTVIPVATPLKATLSPKPPARTPAVTATTGLALATTPKPTPTASATPPIQVGLTKEQLAAKALADKKAADAEAAKRAASVEAAKKAEAEKKALDAKKAAQLAETKKIAEAKRAAEAKKAIESKKAAVIAEQKRIDEAKKAAAEEKKNAAEAKKKADIAKKKAAAAAKIKAEQAAAKAIADHQARYPGESVLVLHPKCSGGTRLNASNTCERIPGFIGPIIDNSSLPLVCTSGYHRVGSACKKNSFFGLLPF